MALYSLYAISRLDPPVGVLRFVDSVESAISWYTVDGVMALIEKPYIMIWDAVAWTNYYDLQEVPESVRGKFRDAYLIYADFPSAEKRKLAVRDAWDSVIKVECVDIIELAFDVARG